MKEFIEISKETFEGLINSLKTMDEYILAYENMGIYLDGGDKPILNSFYEIIDILIKDYFSDASLDLVYWYVFKEDFEKSYDGFKIDNIDDLYNLIVKYNESESKGSL